MPFPEGHCKRRLDLPASRIPFFCLLEAMTPNWFVAWPVSGLDDLLAELKREAPGGLHFLDPSDVHVTFAFLGRYEPVIEGKMARVLETLPLSGIDAGTDELIALPQPRRFSAIAFTLRTGLVDANAQIAKWRARICREAGAPIDTRAKLPHLTIARPDRRIGADDRQAVLDWLDEINASPRRAACRLERPRLYTWTDRMSERRYRLLDGTASKS